MIIVCKIIMAGIAITLFLGFSAVCVGMACMAAQDIVRELKD